MLGIVHCTHPWPRAFAASPKCFLPWDTAEVTFLALLLLVSLTADFLCGWGCCSQSLSYMCINAYKIKLNSDLQMRGHCWKWCSWRLRPVRIQQGFRWALTLWGWTWAWSSGGFCLVHAERKGKDRKCSWWRCAPKALESKLQQHMGTMDVLSMETWFLETPSSLQPLFPDPSFMPRQLLMVQSCNGIAERIWGKNDQKK